MTDNHRCLDNEVAAAAVLIIVHVASAYADRFNGHAHSPTRWNRGDGVLLYTQILQAV